jgi:hypothetical protein
MIEVMSALEVVAAVSALANVGLVLVVVLQIRQTNRLLNLNERTLGISAYDLAVRQFLDFKRHFPPATFANELARAGVGAYVPANMSPDDFLVFARGIWVFSFVYSVFSRDDIDLTKEEKAALQGEVKLWMSLPGFQEV